MGQGITFEAADSTIEYEIRYAIRQAAINPVATDVAMERIAAYLPRQLTGPNLSEKIRHDLGPAFADKVPTWAMDALVFSYGRVDGATGSPENLVVLRDAAFNVIGVLTEVGAGPDWEVVYAETRIG